jgi:hypothetical protein
MGLILIYSNHANGFLAAACFCVMQASMNGNFVVVGVCWVKVQFTCERKLCRTSSVFVAIIDATIDRETDDFFDGSFTSQLVN